jgi:peptidyl-prolyl cis-trans isomerase C
VSTLEQGKFTREPVKTQFGHHVILLEDARPIEAPPLDKVKPQLAQPVPVPVPGNTCGGTP